MERHYDPIPSQAIRPGTVVPRPAAPEAPAVTPEDPALSVMTDLTRVPAVLVDPEVDIEAALRIMVRRNVRSLLVVNVDNEIVGLISAADLLGEKPLQHIQEHGGRRADIRVHELMTPLAQLEVLPLSTVRQARVGNVRATLERAGHQHALVIDESVPGHAIVRGIFSATQIDRQLGRTVAAGPVAHTFAGIEAALAH
jgi:CBS domain containing-hemolysin-like protein